MSLNSKNMNPAKGTKYSFGSLEKASTAILLDRTISVAPMMGCTDRHCRALFRLISPHSLNFSEMITTGALIHGDAQHFLKHQDDEPCVLQLGGSDPVALAECAVMVEDAGYQEINLNVGCPSDRVQYGGIGACLMAKPDLVASCIEAMQKVVKIPVSVKCRIGIDDDDSYESFHSFIDTVAQSGCEFFYVHARKAILEGLSPKQNREIPPLKYDYVYQIKEAFPDLFFSLNGGLKSLSDVEAQLDLVDSVMLGRAPYHDPYLLAQFEENIFQNKAKDRLKVLDEYIDYGKAALKPHEHPKHMLKHILGLFLGCTGAKKFRRYLSDHMFEETCSLDIVYDALEYAELEITN